MMMMTMMMTVLMLWLNYDGYGGDTVNPDSYDEELQTQ